MFFRLVNLTKYYFIPMFTFRFQDVVEKKHLQDSLTRILLEVEIDVTSNCKKYDDKERKPQKHTQRWQTSMHMVQREALAIRGTR